MLNKQFIITEDVINQYRIYLRNEEHAAATVEKYTRDIRAFANFLDGKAVTKELAIIWKERIMDNHETTSVNSMLVSINGFFAFFELNIKIKSLKVQYKIFLPAEKELTKTEYERLLQAAIEKHDDRMCCIMKTICSTGIRVSELRFFTIEAVKSGQVKVTNKGKTRIVFIPNDLKKVLLRYITQFGIISGCVFVTKNGKPLNRSNIWAAMKKLCKAAKVDESKVFPHSLRALFARMYFRASKDIVKLSNILGHNNVNTTRIYIMESEVEHFKVINSLRLAT